MAFTRDEIRATGYEVDANGQARRVDASVVQPASRLPPHLKAGWGNAKPTHAHGRRFGSKMELRIFERLLLQSEAFGGLLFVHVSFPLFNLAPDEKHGCARISIDFVLVGPDGSMRCIDGKPRNWKSRDWQRGARAFTALYGIEIELVDR